jgi:hypothetical protein
VRADVARLILNEVLDPEIVDVFSAITSRRLSVLACAPPAEPACEPRTIVDTLLLLLRLEGLQPETAVALVGAVAPLVVQTQRVAGAESGASREYPPSRHPQGRVSGRHSH